MERVESVQPMKSQMACTPLNESKTMFASG